MIETASHASQSSRALFYALLFGSAGLVVLGWGMWQLSRMRRAQSWPSVEGRVREASLEGERLEESERTLATEVRYTYEVGTRLYTGRRVNFGDELKLASRFRRSATALSRLIQGNRVNVRYNPANPDDAVLDVSSVPRLKAAVGLALTYFALAGLFFWLVDHEVIEGARAVQRAASAAGFVALAFWATQRP